MVAVERFSVRQSAQEFKYYRHLRRGAVATARERHTLTTALPSFPWSRSQLLGHVPDESLGDAEEVAERERPARTHPVEWRLRVG